MDNSPDIVTIAKWRRETEGPENRPPEGITPESSEDAMKGDAEKGKGKRRRERKPGELETGSEVEIAHEVASVLADQFCFGEHLTFAEGAFWVWEKSKNDETPRWRKLPDPWIETALVMKFDGRSWFNTDSEKSGFVKLSDSQVKGIMNRLRVIVAERSYDGANPWGGNITFKEPSAGINCVSGFIRIADDGKATIEEHKPEHQQRHMISAHWEPGKFKGLPPGSMLYRLLHGSLHDHPDKEGAIRLLKQVAGAAISGIATKLIQPKALILYGASAENGKSQIIDMIKALLPKEAVGTTSPENMDKPEYVMQLSGKLLNAPDELSGSKALDSQVFKKAITGQEIEARLLYKNPVQFHPKAQHVFATNVLPTFSGGFDKGVRRRLMVLSFGEPVPIEQRIPNIAQQILAKEMDLLLAWAVEGARELAKRKDFDIPETSQQELADWVLGADAVAAWADERVAYTEGSAMVISAAYQDFMQWCQACGIRHYPERRNFTARAKQFLPKGVYTGRETGGRRDRVRRNVALVY